MTAFAERGPDGIAIVGLAGRFPGAGNITELWGNLSAGVESIRRFDKEELKSSGVAAQSLADGRYVPARGVLDDVRSFDAEFFGYSPREAELMDPQQRIFLETAWHALEDAGIDPSTFDGRVGVYASCFISSYLHRNILPGALAPNDLLMAVLGNDKDYLASRVAYKFDLHGPALTIQSACSSSLAAVHVACQALAAGECDVALVGGISIELPQTAGYIHQEGGQESSDGHCRAFDQAASGTVSSNGAGVVVLRRMSDALSAGSLIYAAILGSAVNNDGGQKAGFTAPSVEGQEDAIREAIAVANVRPETIGFVETHGTGTPLGDPIEAIALAKAYKRAGSAPPCFLGAIKTNIGHLNPASGIVGLIKAALAVYHGEIPPTLHFTAANKKTELDRTSFRVNTVRMPWPDLSAPRRAGINSLGLGGTNVHVIIEQAPARTVSEKRRPYQILPFSAKSKAALVNKIAEIHRFLCSHPSCDLADVAHVLQVGRAAFGWREIIVCRSVSEAIGKLEEILQSDGEGACQLQDARRVKVAFLCSGLGGQYAGMARQLYESEGVFREQMDRCAAILQGPLGEDIRSILYRKEEPDRPAIDFRRLVRGRGEGASSDISGVLRHHAVVFSVEYSLAQLWLSWGIKLDAVLGSSIGEYVCATLAGILPLEAMLNLIVDRSKLIGSLPSGDMLLVGLGPGDVKKHLPADVYIAVYATAEYCVVAGASDGVSLVESKCRSLGIISRRLDVEHPFHCPLLDPIRPAFSARMGREALSPPGIRLLSSLTGDWLSASQATTAQYWVNQTCESVQLLRALENLAKAGVCAFVEMGAGQSMGAFLQQSGIDLGGRPVVTSLRHRDELRDDNEILTTALAKLWKAGGAVDWHAYGRGFRRQVLSLPGYSFARREFWVEPRGEPVRPDVLAKDTDSLENWFYCPRWEMEPAPAVRKNTVGDSVLLLLSTGHSLENECVARLMPCPAVEFIKLGDSQAGMHMGSDDREASIRLQLGDGIERATKRGRVTQIVHLWSSMAPSTPLLGDGLFHLQLASGAQSLLMLVQEFVRRYPGDAVELYVITNGSQFIETCDKVDVVASSMAAAIRVISQEYPNIRTKLVDLRWDDGVPRCAAALARELSGEVRAEDGIVAFRGGRRWVKTVVPFHLHPLRNRCRMKESGIYVVFGGLGRIGYMICRYLAAKYKARILVVGRTAVEPIAGWASSDPGKLDLRQGQLIALEKLGAKVEYYKGNIGDERAVLGALERAAEVFGGVNGIFHAAGSVDADSFATIADLKPAKLFTQLNEKWASLCAIKRFCVGRTVDLCFVVSSLSPILGGLGFYAYASSNALIDGFVDRECTAAGPEWIGVNWADWEKAGSSPAEQAGLRASVQSFDITEAEGEQTFDLILAGEAGSQIIISSADLNARKKQWTITLKEKTAAAALAEIHKRPSLPSAYISPKTGLEVIVIQIWESALNISGIGSDDDFFELGGNSMIGLQIIAHLRRDLSVDIPLMAIFDCPTPATLARRIDAGQAAGSSLADPALEEGVL